MPEYCNNFCPNFESLKLEGAVFPLSPASYVYDFVPFVSSKGPNVWLYIIGKMIGFLVPCWEQWNLCSHVGVYVWVAGMGVCVSLWRLFGSAITQQCTTMHDGCWSYLLCRCIKVCPIVFGADLVNINEFKGSDIEKLYIAITPQPSVRL